jgi:hypothetical protein
MVVLIRVARVVLLLVLASVAVSLVIAIAGPTGGVEKVGLAALIAVYVAMGVGITSAATHLKKRIGTVNAADSRLPGDQPVIRTDLPRCRRLASTSQSRSAAASATLSSGGTKRPGRRPSLVWPRASGSPPTAVAMTGSPRARASVTTIPYVSAREASTSTSAAPYAWAKPSPICTPGKRAHHR